VKGPEAVPVDEAEEARRVEDSRLGDCRPRSAWVVRHLELQPGAPRHLHLRLEPEQTIPLERLDTPEVDRVTDLETGWIAPATAKARAPDENVEHYQGKVLEIWDRFRRFTESEGLVQSRWELTATPRTSTYERPKRPGFVKVAADPERRVLVGAVAIGPEAGEWCQQLTLAIRAEVPLDVLLDVIQPYPTFSEAVFLALQELPL